MDENRINFSLFSFFDLQSFCCHCCCALIDVKNRKSSNDRRKHMFQASMTILWENFLIFIFSIVFVVCHLLDVSFPYTLHTSPKSSENVEKKIVVNLFRLTRIGSTHGQRDRTATIHHRRSRRWWAKAKVILKIVDCVSESESDGKCCAQERTAQFLKIECIAKYIYTQHTAAKKKQRKKMLREKHVSI